MNYQEISKLEEGCHGAISFSLHKPEKEQYWPLDWIRENLTGKDVIVSLIDRSFNPKRVIIGGKISGVGSASGYGAVVGVEPSPGYMLVALDKRIERMGTRTLEIYYQEAVDAAWLGMLREYSRRPNFPGFETKEENFDPREIGRIHVVDTPCSALKF